MHLVPDFTFCRKTRQLNGFAEGLSQGFKWVTRGKFLRQAEKLGLAPRMMEKEIDRLTRRIVKRAPLVEARLAAHFPSTCYAQIVGGILSRSEQLAGF